MSHAGTCVEPGCWPTSQVCSRSTGLGIISIDAQRWFHVLLLFFFLIFSSNSLFSVISLLHCCSELTLVLWPERQDFKCPRCYKSPANVFFSRTYKWTWLPLPILHPRMEAWRQCLASRAGRTRREKWKKGYPPLFMFQRFPLPVLWPKKKVFFHGHTLCVCQFIKTVNPRRMLGK